MAARLVKQIQNTSQSERHQSTGHDAVLDADATPAAEHTTVAAATAVVGAERDLDRSLTQRARARDHLIQILMIWTS